MLEINVFQKLYDFKKKLYKCYIKQYKLNSFLDSLNERIDLLIVK